MRNAFIRALEELAAADGRVTLVVGDLGYSVVEEFARRFPKQFLNVGVAEQNMTGVAAGMALCGRVAVTYSIANFPTLRCLEQIRNDVCYNNANVKVVAVGGGLAYGTLGMSHHGTEDLAIVRALPNMLVVAPGDPVEAGLATRAVIAHQGPCYLRLGKAGEPVVHTGPVAFELGKAITVRAGEDLTLITTGSMLADAVKAADLMAKDGIRARVLSMHTVKPLDQEAVLAAVRETAAVVTIEEHSVAGGLGGAVAEVLAEMSDINGPFLRLGLPPAFVCEVGGHSYLRKAFGLTPEGILKSLQPLLERLVRRAR